MSDKNKRLEQLTDEQIVCGVKQAGSMNKAADHFGVPRPTFKRRAGPLMRSVMVTQRAPKPVKIEAPVRGKKCFIFSSAQNGTAIHGEFLSNLEAYAKHLKAPLHISGFTYNKSLFEDHSKEQPDYHERVKPYLISHPFDIAEKIMFCGEMNTLPTATNPLEGFEAYTRSRWGVFPHPRVQLKSIATMFKAAPKIIMTTGAVTHRNYVQKKAGIKAEFHHVIGAVLVEVDDDGDYFCRHLLAEKDGSFQDLDVRVNDGKITSGHRVEAVTWGDIHAERLDPAVALGAWGLDADDLSGLVDRDPDDTMLDALRPKYQFFHDVLDFRRRNHHNIRDPHFRFDMWVNGTESVEDEIARVAEFLDRTRRSWCRSFVVDSNHDRALKRWLREADYRQDPPNARFFLSCQAALYEAIEKGDENFMVAEWAAKQYFPLDDVTFLHNTDSFMICGGIECALHGDLGANGAKGFVNQFARMGPKANIAHHHGAEIFEGIFQAGHSCNRDMVFNRGGLSSWNPSHIVTYPSGKRTIVTMQGSKWRA